MPPQIKQDLNRSGWETTDFPSVCERCLPESTHVQMLKEDYGAECRICSRPFTLFTWKADRTARQKKTAICLTCARLKNCCQCCMLDLSFGLSIPVRDAALKMIAPGPQSDINKQYYAQEHEREIEEGRGAVEAYQKQDEKARELLRRVANSDAYRKRRRLSEEADDTPSDGSGQRALPAPPSGGNSDGVGPIRTKDTRASRVAAVARTTAGGNNSNNNRRPFPGTGQLPPRPEDYLPPQDPKIMSLFVTGVEDDLPEHEIRSFFEKFGPLRSLICSHRAHCAYVNYQSRKAAEEAAESCKGRAIVKGVPLRVGWGKPKPLDTMGQDERMTNAKAGRRAFAGEMATKRIAGSAPGGALPAPQQESLDDIVVAPPPGDGEDNYASLAGN